MRNLLADSASTLYVPSVLFPIVLSVSLDLLLHLDTLETLSLQWLTALSVLLFVLKAVLCSWTSLFCSSEVPQLDLTLITSGVKGPAGD